MEGFAALDGNRNSETACASRGDEGCSIDLHFSILGEVCACLDVNVIVTIGTHDLRAERIAWRSGRIEVPIVFGCMLLDIRAERRSNPVGHCLELSRKEKGRREPPLGCRVAVEQTPREQRIVIREFAHEADELRNRVLIDRHEAVTRKQLVEIAVRIVPEAHAIGIKAISGVGWHVGADTTIKDDFSTLAAADILQRREAKLCKPAFLGNTLDSRGCGVVCLVVLWRHKQQIGMALAARALRHDAIEERTNSVLVDLRADIRESSLGIKRTGTPFRHVWTANAAVGALIRQDRNSSIQAGDSLAAVCGAVAVQSCVHHVGHGAFCYFQIAFHRIEKLVFSLVIQDFFTGKGDRHSGHLWREVSIIEQFNGLVRQDIKAVVPLAVHLIDLKALTNARTGIRLPEPLALEHGKECVAVRNEVLIALRAVLKSHRKNLTVMVDLCNRSHGRFFLYLTLRRAF
nr:MAG TPA: hypothetical protein [Caudoviricetes sp.]